MPYISSSTRVARAAYDFAIDGGAAGAIVLRGDKIPGGAIILDSIVEVQTALTGGTVTDTVSLGTETAADIVAATARNAAPWSTTGTKRGSLTGGTAPVRTTVDRTPTLTVSTSALTGGKLTTAIRYMELSG